MIAADDQLIMVTGAHLRNHTWPNQFSRTTVICLHLQRTLYDLNRSHLARDRDAERRAFHDSSKIRSRDREVWRHQMLDLVNHIPGVLQHLQQRIHRRWFGHPQLCRWSNNEIVLTTHKHRSASRACCHDITHAYLSTCQSDVADTAMKDGHRTGALAHMPCFRSRLRRTRQHDAAQELPITSPHYVSPRPKKKVDDRMFS